MWNVKFFYIQINVEEKKLFKSVNPKRIFE